MQKPLVLLADDNEATCTLIRAVLHAEYDVEIAGDGGETIEKLRSRRYHVVLLDLLMPMQDGYAVLDFLRDERPDIFPRVLVVTAAVTTSQMERLRTYPIADAILKPFEVDVLLAAVRRCAGASDPAPPAPGGGLLASTLLISSTLLL